MKKKLVDILKQVPNRLRQVFHPNRITASSVGFSVLGLGLLQSPSTDVIGLAVLGLGYATDAIDGLAAREWEMQTIEGARLDPLIDKVRNVIVGGYIGGLEIMKGNYFLPVTMTVNFVVDYISQKSRGDITDQLEEGYNAVVYPENCHMDVDKKSSVRANWFGKTKAIIQAGVGIGYLGMKVFGNHNMLPEVIDDNASYVFGAALGLSAVLGGVGLVKRMRNRV